ncbi:MAG: hypothetical protein E3J64_01835, partial [Anaerolineales bacterium]
MKKRLKRLVKRSPRLYRAYLALRNGGLRVLHPVLSTFGVRYVPPANPVTEVRRIDRTAADAGAASGTRVLFFSLRGWANHLLWEATLAHALQLRGARCDFVACDHVLSACDTKTVEDTSAALCDYCGRLARGLPAQFGLAVHRLSSFATAAAAEQMDRLAQSVEAETVAGESVAGLLLGDAIGASLTRFTLTGRAAAEDPAAVVARRGFLASAAYLAQACRDMLDRLQPDRIVVLNGMFVPEQILMAVARERGIPVLTYEQGNKIRNTLIFAWNRPANRETLDEVWERHRTLPLTDAEGGVLDKYILGRARGAVGSEQLWPEMEADKASIRARLGLDDRPIVSLFTNILWDTAMYQTQVGFADMFDWLRTTLSEMSRR